VFWGWLTLASLIGLFASQAKKAASNPSPGDSNAGTSEPAKGKRARRRLATSGAPPPSDPESVEDDAEPAQDAAQERE